MISSQEQMDLLQGILARHFRSAQQLYQNALAERAALYSEDAAALQRLAEQRETLLDQLNSLDQSCRRAIHSLVQRSGADQDNLGAVALKRLLPQITADEAKSKAILRLSEGSRVIMEQTRALARGNRALAEHLLDRANDLQALFVPGRVALPALFAALVAARDVLTPQEAGAAPASKVEFQAALNDLNRCLELPQSSSWPISERPHPAEPATLGDGNLAEVIAGLYHQETAYRAVLQGCNRLLISA